MIVIRTSSDLTRAGSLTHATLRRLERAILWHYPGVRILRHTGFCTSWICDDAEGEMEICWSDL